MNRFNKSDKVRIKEDLIGGQYYGGLYFSEEMEKYCGLETEISRVANYYKLNIDKGEWYWSDEMLEKVEKKRETLYETMDRMEKEIIKENSQIKFAKLRPNAIIPSKRAEDGAFDIYACFDEDYMVIEPHETKMIPTGLISAFSDDYVAILKERGSTGTKGMGQRAGVVDSGYRGEWFVPITNHNEKTLIITKKGYSLNEYRGDIENKILWYSLDDEENNEIARSEKGFIIYPYEKAICQCVMVEVPKLTIKECTVEEIKSIPSERGEGKLGDSGK